ncbi:hypothetical protein [Streptomyces sp. NPDC057696]|uniref:hypothetical protein n=1 Tax=Streptomyces sp. NPDC057696 TaxID=3346218 RepID=UPI0036A27C41
MRFGPPPVPRPREEPDKGRDLYTPDDDLEVPDGFHSIDGPPAPAIRRRLVLDGAEPTPPAEQTKYLSWTVDPIVNEDTVLRTALKRFDGSPPASCDEANERILDLAIRFHEVESAADETDHRDVIRELVPFYEAETDPSDGVQRAIAVSCPTRPNDEELVELSDSPRPDRGTSDPTLDWFATAITAATGNWDAAAVRAGRTAIKEKAGWAAGMTRCFADGLMIYLMPTAVVGQAVTMLSDAVRKMNEKSEDQVTKQSCDFLTTQAVGAFLRHGAG